MAEACASFSSRSLPGAASAMKRFSQRTRSESLYGGAGRVGDRLFDFDSALDQILTEHQEQDIIPPYSEEAAGAFQAVDSEDSALGEQHESLRTIFCVDGARRLPESIATSKHANKIWLSDQCRREMAATARGY